MAARIVPQSNSSQLSTDRIEFGDLSNMDVDIIFKFNSCKECLTYIVREPFKTKVEAQDKLNAFLSGCKNGTAYWWVFTLKETSEKIGYGGLFNISEEHNRAEIGYGITKEHWNKGYMSEIIKAMIDFGKDLLRLHKIYAYVLEGNEASVRLLEKNGFKKEAHLKQHSFTNGKFWDETIYSLINK